MNVTHPPAETAETGAAKPPAHAQVYHELRNQILFGELAPGEAVTIQGLTAKMQAGMTPVREAIRRLIAEGALILQGNRRVSVPTLTSNDVKELVFIRKTLEPELARRAANLITNAEISALEAIDKRLDEAISQGDVQTYLEQNYRFHTALYEVADAPILAEVADRLWLRFGPSLRVVCGRFGTQNLPDKHHELLAALHARAAEDAARAIQDDIEQGMTQVLAAFGTCAG